MRHRIPLVLSITALVVAAVGTTPLGQAAGDRLSAAIPRFAKTSGFAKLAGNSKKLNGRRSTLVGAPGTIPVVGKNGKLPASIGAVGPQGPAGAQGPRGPVGPTLGVASGVGGTYLDVVEIGSALQVTAGSSGTLFVFGRIQAVVTCKAAASCNRHYQIHVDGKMVRGTLVEVHGNPGETVHDNLAVFGTVSVDSGAHTIRFRAANNPGVASSLDVAPNLGAIELGS